MKAFRSLIISACLILATFGSSTVPRFEDEPGWQCATMGNRVCGQETGR